MISFRVAIIIFFLFLCNAWGATYRWTDDHGNLCLSDNLANVPQKMRSRVQVEDDITMDNPEVRLDVEQGRKRAAEIAQQEHAQKLVRERERTEQETLARKVQEREDAANQQKAAQLSQQTPVKVAKRRGFS
jgi:hypothetical protein